MTPRHTVVNLLNTKDKEKTFEAARENSHTAKGATGRLITETQREKISHERQKTME